jgi:hypothetical protein
LGELKKENDLDNILKMERAGLVGKKGEPDET